MTDIHSIAAIGVIAAVWRPAALVATVVCGGFLVAAIFPKHARGRTDDGAKGRVLNGWKSLHAAPVGGHDATPAAAVPDPAPGQWREYAREPEADPEPLPEPEASEPSVAAAPGGDPASHWAAPNVADGEQIQGRYCKMDTASTEEGLEFTIEVPGFKDSDLEIRIIADTIVVSGRLDLDRTDKTHRVVERDYGPFYRFIKICEGVPLHRIQAWLDCGLLTVFVPNPTVQAGRTIAINSAVRRIVESDDACELQFDLPGVDESDIDLAVRDGLLTIRCRDGQREDRAGEPAGPAPAARLLQSMDVPAGVDANQIRAVLAKGVLTVILPIAAAHRQRTIPLETVGEAAGPATTTSSVGAEPRPPDAGRRQSEAPNGGQMAHPFDYWIAGDPLSGIRGSHG